MKRFFKILAAVSILLTLLGVTMFIRGDGYLLKGLWACYLHGNNSATISDAKYFDTKPIKAGTTVWEWPVHSQYNKQPLSGKLQQMLSTTKSVAFLVVKNDSIISENYWDGYSGQSRSNSFSMAKSITTMLVQIAIQKGILKDWHQKVNTLLPELKGDHAAELELWHLSTMSSGLLWDEAYKNPFSITAKAYYGNDVSEVMMKLPIKDTPGKFYNYQSGSTQLLGMCLMKATGKGLAQLASEWLWQPLQAKHDAQWHTDGKGVELAYCCFNTNARDFARFGRLVLHHGNWNGTQILDSAFVAMATTGALEPFYGYSFWLDEREGVKVIAQRGILGQYIITIPAYNLVVVRLGHQKLKPIGDRHHSEDFEVIVDEVVSMFKQ